VEVFSYHLLERFFAHLRGLHVTARDVDEGLALACVQSDGLR
jgi:hypothetical protein